MADKKYIVDFFEDLKRSPEKQQAFENDPDGTMAAAGFTAEDIATINSGDADRIRAYLGDDAPEKVSLFWA